MYPEVEEVRSNSNGYNVTYIGSLIPSKGFHILAKSWKKVLQKIPQARLQVIGSGQLYNKNSKLGKYGIAEEQYETKFMRYLVDKKGNVLDSVNFFGVLGYEKNEVIMNTSVGVPNPTGRTETFGLSALDFESRGVPVVTIKKTGFLDTVQNRHTGLLYSSKFLMANYIIRLLKNNELNHNLGINGAIFANRFLPERIIPIWENCFSEVYSNIAPSYIEPSDNYFSNFKIIRITIRNLRKYNVLSWIPSMIDIESFIIKLIRK